MNNVNFTTGTTNKVYRLANNDWYAVWQDDEKVTLIDTDCKVAGEELITFWTKARNPKTKQEDSDNGQYLLDYTNNLVERYFLEISNAIIPREVNCSNKDGLGKGKLVNAYMWPMSVEEVSYYQDIAGKIYENANGNIWTRTFSDEEDGKSYPWNSSWGGTFSAGKNSYEKCFVAPAFYLDKSKILCITENNEIILKKNNLGVVSEKLLYNAILYLFDTLCCYKGIDDDCFIKDICEVIGFTKEEYNNIMFS